MKPPDRTRSRVSRHLRATSLIMMSLASLVGSTAAVTTLARHAGPALGGVKTGAGTELGRSAGLAVAGRRA